MYSERTHPITSHYMLLCAMASVASSEHFHFFSTAEFQPDAWTMKRKKVNRVFENDVYFTFANVDKPRNHRDRKNVRYDYFMFRLLVALYLLHIFLRFYQMWECIWSCVNISCFSCIHLIPQLSYIQIFLIFLLLFPHYCRPRAEGSFPLCSFPNLLVK